MYKSAKTWFEAANGQQVTREVIEGRHAGTWEQEKAQAKIDAEKRGFLLVSEDDQEINFALGAQTASLRRSKMPQKVTGLFRVRSSDYFLMVEGTPQYGEKKGAEIEGASMIKTYYWGKCRFTIGGPV